MNLTELYQEHLNRVSRSFAFCIPRLEGELRHWVALSYLLFRVVDTIEDASWESRDKQLETFEFLLKIIDDPSSANSLQDWYTGFPATVSVSERELLKDAPILFKNLHTLPPQVSNLIRRSLRDMTMGMIHFIPKIQIGLKTSHELNQYCFFVAGIVGELLTYLVQEFSPQHKLKDSVLLQAHHFGLFLQKINILKDQGQDEKEGRRFLQKRELVFLSLQTHSQAAFDYLAGIPIELRSYRLFCAFSFYLGIYSLPWIEKSWTSKIAKKIPRSMTEHYLREVESNIDDNENLRRLFLGSYDLRKLSINDSEQTPFSEDFTWFTHCYSGNLSPFHLRNLGLV